MQRQCRKANVLRRENKKSSISRPCQSGSDEMEEAKRKREEAAPNSIKSHLKEPSQLFPELFGLAQRKANMTSATKVGRRS